MKWKMKKCNSRRSLTTPYLDQWFFLKIFTNGHSSWQRLTLRMLFGIFKSFVTRMSPISVNFMVTSSFTFIITLVLTGSGNVLGVSDVGLPYFTPTVENAFPADKFWTTRKRADICRQYIHLYYQKWRDVIQTPRSSKNFMPLPANCVYKSKGTRIW